ncbi:MAG: AIR synthase related protein, partial [Chloroflexota bacterium]
WELHRTRIGEITGEPVLEVRAGHEVVASLAPSWLADDAPEYDVTQWMRAPDGGPGSGRTSTPDVDVMEPTAQVNKKIGIELLELLASPMVASRRLLYRTYDQMVGTDTVVGPGGDAAILRIKGRRDGIAIAIDAQPRVAAIDPFVGAAAAVAEAARNLVCMGAEPLGVTDCLNLGNPERQPGASQLRETVAGITAACRELGVPVVSGNVSLYNATRGADIWPTATIGAVGRLADVTEHIPVRTGEEGDLVLLAGDATARLGASAFAAMRDVHEGPVAIDLGLEARLQRAVLAMHRARLVRAAHDRAEGGLAVALAELAIRDGVGLRVTLPAVRGMSLLASLFGEGPSGIVLVVAPRDEARVRALAEEHDVSLRTLGAVGGRDLRIAGVLGVPVSALARAHDEGLPRALGRAPASGADRSGEAPYSPPASRQEA